MNWGDVAKKAVGIGLPVLGTALAGGAGASVGTLIASALGCDPTPIAVASAMTPESVVALAKIQSDERIQLAAQASAEHVAQAQADAASLQAINATIQADSTGKSWLQRNTQSICKLWTLGLLTLIYFILPVAGEGVPAVPESVWLMLGGILGITAWHAGMADTAKVKAAAQAAAP